MEVVDKYLLLVGIYGAFGLGSLNGNAMLAIQITNARTAQKALEVVAVWPLLLTVPQGTILRKPAVPK